jgi:hypothetical protein
MSAHSFGSPALPKLSSIIGVLTAASLTHLMVSCGLSRRYAANFRFTGVLPRRPAFPRPESRERRSQM